MLRLRGVALERIAVVYNAATIFGSRLTCRLAQGSIITVSILKKAIHDEIVISDRHAALSAY